MVILCSVLAGCQVYHIYPLWATGVYKVPYPPPPLDPGGGKFVKSVGEEYQVVKRGRECHGCGEEYNVEKRERGSKSSSL